jgi:hypothetical protein
MKKTLCLLLSFAIGCVMPNSNMITIYYTTAFTPTKILNSRCYHKYKPIQINSYHEQSHKSHLFAKKSSSTPQPPPAQFEYQELRAQFNQILQQKIRPNMLSTEKRNELTSYLMKLLLNRPSPIKLKSLGDNNGQALYGKWTLVYSTEAITQLGDLPREATVQLLMKKDYQCEYKLLFEKTLGLTSITAKSSYIIDTSPVNPGLVTIVYQDIVTDVLWFKSFPVGTFGLLKGRATYVETVWFDGLMWIERGYNAEGVEYYNVYMKDDDEGGDNW